MNRYGSNNFRTDHGTCYLIPVKHGVDTAKYYQQAERELEAERTGNAAP